MYLMQRDKVEEGQRLKSELENLGSAKIEFGFGSFNHRAQNSGEAPAAHEFHCAQYNTLKIFMKVFGRFLHA